MITDPLFFAAAIPAVVVVGLSKGGFGGGVALLGVPLMALVVPPLQAAGIMLPILMVMDAVALTAYRGAFDRRSLWVLLPAGVLGIALGWLTAGWVSEAAVRLIVGMVALAFCLDHWLHGAAGARKPAPHNRIKGTFWGALAGFTSFVSHAGGPPFQMYMLPLRLAPWTFAGTAVTFFAAVNAVKVVPYLLLGQLSGGNLATSAVLMPLAAVAAATGAWLVRVLPAALFYRITYAAVFVVSLKLIWDGVRGVTGV